MTQKHKVELPDEQVERIRSILKSTKTNVTIAARCRILLALDERHPPVLSHAVCAKAHGLCMATVANTVRHFACNGLESVLTLKRSPRSNQARRKLDGRAEASLIATACGPAPKGAVRWTLRLLEKELKAVLLREGTPHGPRLGARNTASIGCATNCPHGNNDATKRP